MHTSSHKTSILTLLLMSVLCASCTPLEKIPPRSMGVSAGPEKVFEQPASEIFSQLQGATLTGNNGRVGNELVFWEYTLPDNDSINLFVCANQEDINCESRISKVCLGGGEEITRQQVTGLVRHLQCRAVGIAGTGDLQPNCEQDQVKSELLAGLMQCQ